MPVRLYNHMLKLARLFLIVGLILLFLAIFVLPSVHAVPLDRQPLSTLSAVEGPPASITVRGQLTFVACGGPCCCGVIATRYMGHWYENSRYCRWFRPLRNGMTVTTTAWLAY